MKKVKESTILIFFLLCLTLQAQAQVQVQISDSLKYEDLIAPESPGFQILGIAPQSIYRPTDSKALGAYFLNQVDSPSGLADDFAIELTPYWLKNRPELTFQEYFGLSEQSTGINITDNIKKTFQLSIASTDYQSDSDSVNGRSWGFGFRTSLIRGIPRIGRRIQLVSDATNASFIDIAYGSVVTDFDDNQNRSDVIQAFEKAFDEMIQNSATNAGKIKMIKSTTMEFLKDNLPSSIDDIKDFIAKEEENIMTDIVKSIRDESTRYTGLQIQMAGALSIDIPSNEFRSTQGKNYGLWLTISHEMNKKGDLHATALMRYMGSFQNIGSTNKDFGLSLSQTGDSYTFSGELIYRILEEEYLTQDINEREITAINRDNTLRFTANFQLKISPDANLTASIGKDFDSEITTNSNVIALLGINFDLFRNQFLKYSNN